MRLLVLTTEPVSADQLRGAVPDGTEPEQAEVMVVAPAVHATALQFWMSDADEAISKAERVRTETVERLGDEGVAAGGDTGESDPEQAIQDALQTFEADRIVLFTHPQSERRYKEAPDPAELERRFGLPVDHALVA